MLHVSFLITEKVFMCGTDDNDLKVGILEGFGQTFLVKLSSSLNTFALIALAQLFRTMVNYYQHFRCNHFKFSF